MSRNPYKSLAQAVTEAGFYTNGFEDHGTWHRTCICANRDRNGCLTGNSFWVSRLASGWYLGAWGGSIYYSGNKEDQVGQPSPGICITDRCSKNEDFLVAFLRPEGA